MIRKCGDCQACCKQLPVVELEKKANCRCEHQKHGAGCKVYTTRPQSCRLWSCAWLIDDDEMYLSRPDHCGFIVDIMPDFITTRPKDGNGESANIEVIQVWVDPQYPNAYRHMTLYRYLQRKRMAAIVRLDERNGVVLVPPELSDTGDWLELGTNSMERTHTAEEKLEAIPETSLNRAIQLMMRSIGSSVE